MNNQICLVVPEAPTVQSAGQPAGASKPQRTLDLAGLRVGLLDNAKANADHLLRLIAEGVKASYPVKSSVMLRKSTSGVGAPAAILQQLTDEADVVVSAMAD